MWGTFFFKSRGLNVPDSNDATSCFSSLSLKKYFTRCLFGVLTYFIFDFKNKFGYFCLKFETAMFILTDPQ